jgi:putative ABC transport system substrate-binding protein
MAGLAQVAPHRNFERRLVTSLYAGRIPKGAKTADLPVMQSTKFEIRHQRTDCHDARLEVPPTLLARADEVIE